PLCRGRVEEGAGVSRGGGDVAFGSGGRAGRTTGHRTLPSDSPQRTTPLPRHVRAHAAVRAPGAPPRRPCSLRARPTPPARSPRTSMPILPLPQFEADLEEDRKLYESLKPPTSIVVRFGVLKMIGEFPYDGDAKPGCGSKLVVRTHRGTEIGEMLTSTCPNAGCSKSVTRKQMLEYIENSGGKDYPFFNQGR